MTAPSYYRSFSIRRILQVHSHLWFHRVSAEVTSVQFGVLDILSRGRLGQRELGRAAQLDKSSLAEMLRRIERNGLVVTAWDETDRRRKTVELTAAGLEVVRELRPRAAEVDRLLCGTLTEEEGVLLDQLMEKVLASEVAVAASIA